MDAERFALVVIEFAFIGLGLFILLGIGLWVFGEAKDIYVKATERLHRRKMETFDKLIALEKVRNGYLVSPVFFGELRHPEKTA